MAELAVYFQSHHAAFISLSVDWNWRLIEESIILKTLACYLLFLENYTPIPNFFQAKVREVEGEEKEAGEPIPQLYPPNPETAIYVLWKKKQ